MDLYGLEVIGWVAMEDGRVGRVPMQNYMAAHVIAFTFMVGMCPQNCRWGRPKYQTKAEIRTRSFVWSILSILIPMFSIRLF